MTTAHAPKTTPTVTGTRLSSVEVNGELKLTELFTEIIIKLRSIDKYTI